VSEDTPGRPAAGRMDPQDVRRPRTTTLSGREAAAILELARKADPRASLSAWLREAALEKLGREAGWVDDVRRAAPKSTNRQPRTSRQREERQER